MGRRLETGVAIGREEGFAIGYAEGIVLGRAEGIAIGRAEGIAISDSKWRAWNARREKAAARGAPFDEPPPSFDA